MLALAASAWMGACVDFGALGSSDAGPDDAGSDDTGRADVGLSDAAITSEASVADAAAVDAAGPPADAGPAWQLYAKTDSFPNQWNVTSLEVAWTGANAPPPRGILAVAQLNNVDRLLVWTDEGRFYVRAAGAWLAPRTTTAVFPALAGLDFRGCYHQPNEPSPGVEEIVLVDNPKAVLYTYTQADVITFESTVTLSDEPAPYGAPKGSKKLRWVTRSWDPLKADASTYLAEYSAYENDPYVYFFDATARPTNKWLFADAPIFKATTSTPPETAIMSAWRDDAAKTFYMLVR